METTQYQQATRMIVSNKAKFELSLVTQFPLEELVSA